MKRCTARVLRGRRWWERRCRNRASEIHPRTGRDLCTVHYEAVICCRATGLEDAVLA